MKTFKKSLSLFLCVCLFASIAVVAAFPASANYGDEIHRPLVTDIPADVETNTFYFYMPESWRNEYNDAYDGVSLDSCKAGVYWWGGDYSCENVENQNGTGQGWPGYVIPDTDPADSNIFVAKVPTDSGQIIFNNAVNGTNDPDNPAYTKAIQTDNIGSEFYDPDEDQKGFYPNGTTTFDGMIYVCNPKETIINDYSGKETYKGVWFYYYGDGTYSYYPTKEEAEANNAVYSKGEFPPYGFQVDETAEVVVGEEATIGCNDNTATAVSADTSIATVTKDEATGTFKVKGVKAGTTTVTFTLVKEVVDAETGETSTKVETAVCTVTVKAKPVTPVTPVVTKKANTMNVKANTLSVKLKKAKAKKQTFTAKKAFKFAKKAQGTVTYKKVSGDSKLSINNKNGKITLKKVTKAKTYKIKVKVTAAGNKNYKSKSQTVTVKIKVKK